VVGNGTPASCTEAALTAALAGGGAVTFNCGGPATILVLSEKAINQDTVIQGGGAITLTGGQVTRLFRVVAPASLTLNNIILDSAYSPSADGGAILSNGTLSLNNVTIQNSQAGPAFCGGAIRSDGLALITHSRFSKNSAGAGGAICTAAAGAPTLRISHSRFNNNQAVRPAPDTGLGGAILLKQTATLDITGSSFTGNKADGGGALAVESGATATVRPEAGQTAAFLGNSATLDGGAIYSLGTLRVYGAQFNSNTVPENKASIGFGGGINNLGSLTLHDSSFSGNRGRFGGGVFVGGSVNNAQADIQRAVFFQNVATIYGGGLYTNNAATVIVVTNSVFERNTAGAGGGLARFNAQLRLLNSSVTRNKALGAGGGLYVDAGPSPGSSSYVQVRSVTFSGNEAKDNQGGGIYKIGRIELYFTTIVGNTGGVHSLLDGNTRFHGSVLYNPGFPNCSGDGSTQISNDLANHVSDASCGPFFPAAGDPQLGPLQDDGPNTTFYHLPLAGSPLINKGPGDCPERDQRGMLRVGACDIGAVEFEGLLPPPTPTSTPTLPTTPTPPPTATPVGTPAPAPAGYRVYLPLVVR
jgi:predicted outer membrane repeat protein